MKTKNTAIEQSWFVRPSTAVAPDLIGCTLVRQFSDGEIKRGTIVEVEAYGPEDPACHAYRKQTPRNAAMFMAGGYSYVYFIYGMYHCLNIVTDRAGVGSAVLIRALEMENNPPPITKAIQRLAAGPGKLCRHLNIDRTLNQIQLDLGQPLWIEPRSQQFKTALENQNKALVQTTRIGLSQGIDLPWRWYLKGSGAISKL
jgi:DNA-3-methyladenine glycosylase